LEKVVMICFDAQYIHLFIRNYSLLPMIRVNSISPQRTQRSAKESEVLIKGYLLLPCFRTSIKTDNPHLFKSDVRSSRN